MGAGDYFFLAVVSILDFKNYISTGFRIINFNLYFLRYGLVTSIHVTYTTNLFSKYYTILTHSEKNYHLYKIVPRKLHHNLNG